MRNYVIIGGSSGIGKSLSEILSSNGNNVIATYNSNPQSDSDNIQYMKFNVLEDELDLDQLPDEIHGLVYCPGSINLKQFHRFSSEDFLEDYKLQVIGATNVIKSLMNRLKRTKASSIVLFSTIAVQNGFNFHSQVSASKGAVEGLTRALAAEFAPKIRVNAIAPSLTETPLAEQFLNTEEKIQAQSKKNPMNRIGSADDVAQAAAYLLSPEASWVTGQIMKVDGGYSSIK